MPVNKRNISNSNIEKEIYNTFEQFKKEKNIIIYDFLNKFNVNIYNYQKYRSINYPYNSMLKLILFQKLKGIKFHTKLTKHLQRNPSIKWKLGFTKTPNRRTIGYFINHILNKETKEQPDFTIAKIEEVSEKFGIILDIKTLEPKPPKKTTKTRNHYLIRIFYFLFSVLLYNLWLLADILIWLSLFGVIKEDHLITSKYFGTVLYTIDPG